MMAERGVTVSYESIREWCLKFGATYSKRIDARRGRLGDRWHLDEVFLRINGKPQYLGARSTKRARYSIFSCSRGGTRKLRRNSFAGF